VKQVQIIQVAEASVKNRKSILSQSAKLRLDNLLLKKFCHKGQFKIYATLQDKWGGVGGSTGYHKDFFWFKKD
jgi:hypothetical protein